MNQTELNQFNTFFAEPEELPMGPVKELPVAFQWLTLKVAILIRVLEIVERLNTLSDEFTHISGEPAPAQIQLTNNLVDGNGHYAYKWDKAARIIVPVNGMPELDAPTWNIPFKTAYRLLDQLVHFRPEQEFNSAVLNA